MAMVHRLAGHTASAASQVSRIEIIVWKGGKVVVSGSGCGGSGCGCGCDEWWV